MNELIKTFRVLYKERKSTSNAQTEEQIREVIKSELLDEFTHPRARKSPEKKLELAYNRISKSSLSDDEQILIKKVYEEEYINLSTEYKT